MTFIPALIAAITARYGVVLARKLGWFPANYYLGRAMNDLHEDNLEKSIQNWKTAFSKNPNDLQSLAVRDFIKSEMDLKVRLMKTRIQMLEIRNHKLNKKLRWSRLLSFIPLRSWREKYRRLQRKIRDAMADVHDEIRQFSEGISVLEKLMLTLYTEEKG